MALKWFHDSAGTREITTVDPDAIRAAVPAGQSLENIMQIFIKTDNTSHEYENVEVTPTGVPAGATVQYSENQTGPWSTALPRPNGKFTVSAGIWRRVVIHNVQDPLRVITIKHLVSFDAYIADPN